MFYLNKNHNVVHQIPGRELDRTLMGTESGGPRDEKWLLNAPDGMCRTLLLSDRRYIPGPKYMKRVKISCDHNTKGRCPYGMAPKVVEETDKNKGTDVHEIQTEYVCVVSPFNRVSRTRFPSGKTGEVSSSLARVQLPRDRRE